MPRAAAMPSSSSFRDLAAGLSRLAAREGAKAARWAYATARDPKTHEALRDVAASIRSAFEGTPEDLRLRQAVAARGDELLRAGDPLLKDLKRYGKGKTVHQRITSLNALGLDPHNVLIVIGEGRDVERYFRARHAGTHLFGRDKVCTICGLPRHAAGAECVPV